METPPQQSNTAAGILDAYLQAVSEGIGGKTADNSGSLKDIVALFETRPVDEFVAACAARKEFDLAVVLLDAAYHRNSKGSLADRKLAKTGLDIVDACVAERRSDIAEWLLNRASEIYSPGTVEHGQVEEKRSRIAEQISASRNLGTRPQNAAMGLVNLVAKCPVRKRTFSTVAVAG